MQQGSGTEELHDHGPDAGSAVKNDVMGNLAYPAVNDLIKAEVVKGGGNQTMEADVKVIFVPDAEEGCGLCRVDSVLSVLTCREAMTCGQLTFR